MLSMVGHVVSNPVAAVPQPSWICAETRLTCPREAFARDLPECSQSE